MIDYGAIGAHIRKTRDRQGITQEYLAERVNVSIPHISRIENGSAKPSLQVLVDICNALNITIDDAMSDTMPAAKSKIVSRLDALISDCTADEIEMIANLAETVLRDARTIYK